MPTEHALLRAAFFFPLYATSRKSGMETMQVRSPLQSLCFSLDIVPDSHIDFLSSSVTPASPAPSAVTVSLTHNSNSNIPQSDPNPNPSTTALSHSDQR